jgi:hypothetical protein
LKAPGTLLVGAAALAGLALVSSAAIGAPTTPRATTTHRVVMEDAGPRKFSGTTISGPMKGKPFGRCQIVGTLVIPKFNFTWRCKAGWIKVSSVATSGASDDVKGTWKILSGTRRYKGIKGKGKFFGKNSTGDFTYTGTARY